MGSIVLALQLLILSASAYAQNIPWFEAHPAERSAVLKQCRDDHHLARTALCANVETAETRAYYKRRIAPVPRDFDPPSTMMREGTRRACARPQIGRAHV